MRQQLHAAAVAAIVAGAVGFAAGTASQPELAGATASDVNTPILRSINRQLTTIANSVGRTERKGVWNEVEDSKDFLRQIELHTRRIR